jgi:hypothetical protein
MSRRQAGARGGRRGGAYLVQPLIRFSDGTFTRASEGSYYLSAPGGAGSTFIAWASSNVLRYDAVDGTPLALFEGPQTNLCNYSEDLNQASWVKTGASISGTTAAAPDGDTDCCTVAFTASATDMMMRTVTGTADGTTYLTTVFARRTSGSGNVRLRVLKRDGVASVSSDLPISTTWTRLEFALNWGTGVATPEVGIINDSAGGAQSVEVWGFDIKTTTSIGSFPTSYIRTTNGSATRNLDLLTFASMPQQMATGRYRFAFRPQYTNAQRTTFSSAFCPSATLDAGIGASSSALVAFNSPTTHFSQSCTWARNQSMTITPDLGALTMTVEGALTGNGVGAVGTNPSFPTTHLRVGSTSALRYAFARIGEPYAA